MNTHTFKKVPLKTTAIYHVLPFIKQFQARHGFSPTHSEISKQFKKKSIWWGGLVLLELKKAKFIKIHKGKNRGITILK